MTMWIDDLTKALYFLNTTKYKDFVCIEKIVDNVVYFTNHRCYPVQALIIFYTHYLKTGEVAELW